MKRIETQRMILRPWALSDADDFFAYAKHPEVGLNGGWPPHENRGISETVIGYFIEEGDVWAVELKENGKVVGSIGLHKDGKRPHINTRELGFSLAAEHWGKGFMTEAALAIVAHAFEEMGLDLLCTYHKTFNERSRRVIEKCGFTQEGILRQASKRYDGQIFDAACYSILKEEYKTR